MILNLPQMNANKSFRILLTPLTYIHAGNANKKLSI